MAYLPTDEDLSLYSDLYKDCYGVRPRGSVPTWADFDDFLACMRGLSDAISAQIDAEREEAREAALTDAELIARYVAPPPRVTFADVWEGV